MRKRSVLASLFTVILILSIFIGDIKPMKAAEDDDRLVDLGIPIQTSQTIDAAFGVENGKNVVYTTVTGSASSGDWAKFNVIDIDNEELLYSFELEGASNAWAHHVTNDGRVFVGASNKMFVYSPETHDIQDLGIPIQGTGSIWSLTSDDEGNVYGGIYSTSAKGRIFKIDAETLEVTDYLGGPVDSSEDYVRSLEYYQGHIYAGTASTNGRVWKIDLTDQSTERIELPGSPDDPIYQGKFNTMGFTYDLEIVDHYLFAFFNGPFTMHVYDLEKQEWREKGLENTRGLKGVTGYHDGKVYTSKKDGNMWEIDVETLEERIAMEFDGSIRKSQWIEVDNQPAFDGPAMVTISYNGEVVIFDPSTQTKVVQDSVIDGIGINLQSIEQGPDGKIYISSYMGTEGAVYDPANDDAVSTFHLGQAEGFGSVGNTMYFGVYPNGEIFGWDTTEPITEAGPTHLFTIGNQQDRPFVLSEGDGKLLIGTIPGYSEHGGALTIYDPVASKNNGEPVYEVFRNIVEDQSITGLAYKDGIVYGSTAIHGGLGADPIADNAKLFAWDMETKQTIHEWELDIDGLDKTVTKISGLTLGPDGLIWGSADGFVFAMNPETYQIEKSKNIYPAVTNSGRWRPIKQVWGSDGLLYSNVGETLTVINPETMDSKMLVEKVSIFDLNKTNDLYYAQATKVMKILAEKPSAVVLGAKDTMTVGEARSYSIEAKLYDWTIALPDSVQVEIVSSDETVISALDGELHAKQAGTATVIAEVNWHGEIITSEKIKITVAGEEPEPIGPSLDVLSEELETYIYANEVRGPLVNQLQNSLKQAKHHLNKGSEQKAVEFVEKFLKHLNNKPMQKHVDDEAKVVLESTAGDIIHDWMN